MPKTIQIGLWRRRLEHHAKNVRAFYAEFRKQAEVLRGRELIRYNRERHAFESNMHNATRSVSVKERETVKLILQLQRNIADQSMLLLEMEHSIKHEETMINAKGL